jgi:DNA-binding XRE family transcriptional regulator
MITGQVLTFVRNAVNAFIFYIFSVSKEKHRKAICHQVAELFRKERLRKNLSMTTLSTLAGLSQQSISYLERELRVPNLDTMLRIAAALEIDLWKIIRDANKNAELQNQ